MTREPLWRRLQRRPSWERSDPLRFSDYDPMAPLHIAINRLAQQQQRMIDRLDAAARARRTGRP